MSPSTSTVAAPPAKARTRSPHTTSFVTKQRVLAVLCRHGGQILSDKGEATGRLANLMPIPYAAQTIRHALVELEKDGKVLRDLRKGKNGTPVDSGQMSSFGGGIRCYGIYMVDMLRDRPEKKYFDELDAAIKERSLKKAVKEQAAAKAKAASPAPAVPTPAAPAVEPIAAAPVPQGLTPEEVADALLAKVMFVIANPPEPVIDTEALKNEQAKVARLQEALQQCNAQHQALEKTNQDLMAKVTKADEIVQAQIRQIKRLQADLEQAKGSGRLTQRIGDIVDIAGLMQPGAPSHTQSKGPAHGRRV